MNYISWLHNYYFEPKQKEVNRTSNKKGWYKGQQKLIVAQYTTHLSELCANSWMHFYRNRKYTGVHIKTNLNIAVYSKVFKEISIFALKQYY